MVYVDIDLKYLYLFVFVYIYLYFFLFFVHTYMDIYIYISFNYQHQYNMPIHGACSVRNFVFKLSLCSGSGVNRVMLLSQDHLILLLGASGVEVESIVVQVTAYGTFI